MLFDTHTHLSDDDYDIDRDGLIAALESEGVDGVIDVAYDIQSARRCVELARYDNVWAAVGVHPHSAKDYTDETENELEQMLKNKKVVALGEIGLDYHYDFSERDIQRDVFARQLALARRNDAKLIIHTREATADTLNILKAYKDYRGIIHCCGESVETAKILLDMGFHIAFGGAVTFKNASRILETAAYIPTDRLLIETDCPYMTPVPYRGKRNEPKWVRLVAEKLAEVRGVTYAELVEQTRNNTRDLFGI